MKKNKQIIITDGISRGSSEYVKYINSLKNPHKSGSIEYLEWQIEYLEHKKYIINAKSNSEKRKKDTRKKILLGSYWNYKLEKELKGEQMDKSIDQFLREKDKRFLIENYKGMADKLKIEIR